MKIAVTYENGQVFGHFGHTAQFKLYEVEDGAVKSAQVIDTQGSGHGALAQLLSAHEIDALICGGIGMGARIALAEAGIDLMPGVVGNADEAVANYLAGNLEFDPNAKCNHHHHEGEHNCGSHACGGHCGEDKHGCSGNH